MKIWNVYGKVVGGIFLGQYSAETKEEAEEKASKDAYVGLCHQCSNQCEDPEVIEIEATDDI